MRILKAASLAAAALLLPASAQAAIKITGISGDPGFRSGTIHYSGPLGTLPNSGPSVNVSVGQIKLTGKDTTTNAAVSFLAYCIDIFDYLKAGLFDVANFTFNPAKEQKLKALLTHTATDIATAGTLDQKKNVSAAIQMSVWEIAFEAEGSPYNVGTGEFRMSGSGLTGLNGGTASAFTLAQGYLGNINSGTWSAADPNYTLRMLVPQDADNNQTQVFLVSTPVPEPSTWALLILGFGVVGGAMRRRRLYAAFA
jgi:hypothetical protein